MVKAKATTSKERDARLDSERLVRESEEARAELAATDWRVIRAMELWLVEHDGLPIEFTQERAAMREKA
jgi:RIO-like serine/threonine protein kinase